MVLTGPSSSRKKALIRTMKVEVMAGAGHHFQPRARLSGMGTFEA